MPETNLSVNDVLALDKFKELVHEACELAAVNLIDDLERVYRNMDINTFLDDIDTIIEDWTYDAMNSDELEDEED